MLLVRNIWQLTKTKNIDPSGEVLTPFGLSLSKPTTFRQAQGERT